MAETTENASNEPIDDGFDPDKLIGQVLANRYQIETKLGEGATGAVYRAKHVKVGRAFAVKVLHTRLIEDKKVLQRFDREAELAGRLHHPNVIGVVDVGELPGDGTRYMVMDFAEGPDLAAMLSEAPMRPQRVIHLTRGMLEGLFHAHEEGLIHRDFKPENVIVEKDSHNEEVPRIVDFGIAILREGGESSNAKGRLTTNGLVLGTPHYMAPEQAVADPIDHRIDLFALGIIVYEMLSGKLPFDGSGAEVARANLLLDPPPISQRVPYLTVDPLLEAFARKLMAKKRDARPATAKAARELLDLIEKDRAAAAAALGVPLEVAREVQTTQPSRPIAVDRGGSDTFPPPVREAVATPAPEPAGAPAPVEVKVPARERVSTEMVEHARRGRAGAIALVLGLAAAGVVAMIVLANRGGSSDKAAKTEDVAALPKSPEPVHEAAPAPPPSPAPAPVDPAPAPVSDPPPAEVVKTPAEKPHKLPVHKVAAKTEVKTEVKATPAVETVVTPPAAETKSIDANAFAAQYQKVGEQLKAFEAAKGADAAQELWNRYRRIRYGEVVSNQASRDASAAVLASIQRDIASHR